MRHLHHFFRSASPDAAAVSMDDCSGDFDEMFESRGVAKSVANRDGGASFIIEIEGVAAERWVRDGGEWARDDG